MSHAIHRTGSGPSHPATPHTSAQRGGEHVVRAGDDLATLSARYAVSPSAIVAANRHLIVDPSRPLVAGDNLRIPSSDAGRAAVHPASAARPATAPSTHYKDVVTLPRSGQDAPPTAKTLKAIVDRLDGYLRPHHAALGNRNRIVHVRGPEAGKEIAFPVKQGTPMVDGNGELRGTVTQDAARINYGQRKVITPPGGQPATYVYVIGTSLHSVAGHDYGASGWIPLSALKDSAARRHYQSDLSAVVRHGPQGGDAPQRYTLDAQGKQLDRYGALKVNPGHDGQGVPRHDRLAASDYLLRPGGAVNLLYSLPGHGGASTDTFKAQRTHVDPSTGRSQVVATEFVPSAGVPRVRVPLYLPAHATAAERADWRDGTSPHTMEFVYGRVGDRYGWIAADALKAA